MDERHEVLPVAKHFGVDARRHALFAETLVVGPGAEAPAERGERLDAVDAFAAERLWPVSVEGPLHLRGKLGVGARRGELSRQRSVVEVPGELFSPASPGRTALER